MGAARDHHAKMRRPTSPSFSTAGSSRWSCSCDQMDSGEAGPRRNALMVARCISKAEGPALSAATTWGRTDSQGDAIRAGAEASPQKPDRSRAASRIGGEARAMATIEAYPPLETSSGKSKGVVRRVRTHPWIERLHLVAAERDSASSASAQCRTAREYRGTSATHRVSLRRPKASDVASGSPRSFRRSD